MDTISAHVEVTPGIAGGKPRIAGHRITVRNVVIWHERLGLSADDIANEYGLSLAGPSSLKTRTSCVCMQQSIRIAALSMRRNRPSLAESCAA